MRKLYLGGVTRICSEVCMTLLCLCVCVCPGILWPWALWQILKTRIRSQAKRTHWTSTCRSVFGADFESPALNPFFYLLPARLKRTDKSLCRPSSCVFISFSHQDVFNTKRFLLFVSGCEFCSEVLQQRAHLPLHVLGRFPLPAQECAGCSEGLGQGSSGHAGVSSYCLLHTSAVQVHKKKRTTIISFYSIKPQYSQATSTIIIVLKMQKLFYI